MGTEKTSVTVNTKQQLFEANSHAYHPSFILILIPNPIPVIAELDTFIEIMNLIASGFHLVWPGWDLARILLQLGGGRERQSRRKLDADLNLNKSRKH